MADRRIKNKIPLTKADQIFDSFNYFFLFLIFVITIYPVYYVLVASISNSTYVNSGELLLYPRGIHFSGYLHVLTDQRIGIGYFNTMIYTLGGTALGLCTSLLAGYSLSRKDLPGRNIVMAFMVFTMYFSGGLIPTYLVVKSLGLLNQRLIVIILGSVSVYNIILIRTFFSSTIPSDLHEAAEIDGCGNIRFFFSIVLPLSKAIVAVIGLYLAVGYWNSYFNALIYLTDRAKHPLQIFLREILLTQTNNDIADGEMASDYKKMVAVIKYAVIVISTLPIMCLYPFLQRYFVQGIMIGSVKG